MYNVSISPHNFAIRYLCRRPKASPPGDYVTIGSIKARYLPSAPTNNGESQNIYRHLQRRTTSRSYLTPDAKTGGLRELRQPWFHCSGSHYFSICRGVQERLRGTPPIAYTWDRSNHTVRSKNTCSNKLTTWPGPADAGRVRLVFRNKTLQQNKTTADNLI